MFKSEHFTPILPRGSSQSLSEQHKIHLWYLVLLDHQARARECVALILVIIISSIKSHATLFADEHFHPKVASLVVFAVTLGGKCFVAEPTLV